MKHKKINLNYVILHFNVSLPKQSSMQQTDNQFKELFADIAQGSKNAFNSLFRTNYRSFVSFARSYVADKAAAEEIVSDAFVWIWLHRDELGCVEKPDVYLFVMVKNRCINALRGLSRFESLDEYPSYIETKHESPLEKMEYKELATKLYAIINTLPNQQRQIFQMVKENGLSAKQTAEILELSPRTVETHLYKAVKKLEEEITRYLGYSPKRKQLNKILAILC